MATVYLKGDSGYTPMEITPEEFWSLPLSQQQNLFTQQLETDWNDGTSGMVYSPWRPGSTGWVSEENPYMAALSSMSPAEGIEYLKNLEDLQQMRFLYGPEYVDNGDWIGDLIRSGVDQFGNNVNLNMRYDSQNPGDDIAVPILSGYTTQLTPNSDAGTYYGSYDTEGNLVDVTYQEHEDDFWTKVLHTAVPLLIGGSVFAGLGGLGGLSGGAAAGAGTGMSGAYLPLGETLGAGMTATTGAGVVGGGIAGTGLTLSELAASTGLSESVLSSAISNGSLTELVDSIAGGLTPGSVDTLSKLGLSDIGKLVDLNSIVGGSGSKFNPLQTLTGGLSMLGAKSIYDKTAAMGPEMLAKYTALGENLQGQAGDISAGIRADMGGMFDAARQQGMDAYGAASQIDLNNLRQQEFDIMQAMFADPRAAQAASVEARQIAQGRGGLQSFNQANSAEFTDPTTGQTYTVGANPADVAMYKAWANDDLNAYLQADKSALNRYNTLANMGNQASSTALGLQDAWNRPLMSGLDAFGRMGATGINAYGNAQFKANDAYANMVAGLMGGVQQATSGSGGTQLNALLNKGANALFDYGADAVGNAWDSFTGLFS